MFKINKEINCNNCFYSTIKNEKLYCVGKGEYIRFALIKATYCNHFVKTKGGQDG